MTFQEMQPFAGDIEVDAVTDASASGRASKATSEHEECEANVVVVPGVRSLFWDSINEVIGSSLALYRTAPSKN